MQSIRAKKVGRNDPCPCGSGKKYKLCCFSKDTQSKGPRIDIFTENQIAASSEEIASCKQLLCDVYPDLKIIDISDNLSQFNYKAFQEKNYEKDLMMLAKKQDNNKLVFDKREAAEEEDIIVMFRGSYRIFAFSKLENSLENICTMVEIRRRGQIDD